MIAGDWKPGFRLELHLKDLDNALAAARDSASPVPVTTVVRQFVKTLVDDGHAGEDHAAIARYCEDIAGARLPRDPVRPERGPASAVAEKVTAGRSRFTRAAPVRAEAFAPPRRSNGEGAVQLLKNAHETPVERPEVGFRSDIVGAVAWRGCRLPSRWTSMFIWLK